MEFLQGERIERGICSMESAETDAALASVPGWFYPAKAMMRHSQISFALLREQLAHPQTSSNGFRVSSLEESVAFR